MALRLYMDVHVPRAITNGLRARGVDVLTAQADGANEYEDDQLLNRALELDRLLFTSGFLLPEAQLTAQRLPDSIEVKLTS